MFFGKDNLVVSPPQGPIWIIFSLFGIRLQKITKTKTRKYQYSSSESVLGADV